MATLIAVRRSAPLPPGARFAISESGELSGSISSGCVEGDLHERLSALLAGAPPATVTYGISDEMAAGVGLSCGGEIDVLLDLHDPGDPVWQRLAHLQDSGAPCVLVSGTEPPARSRHLLLEPERPEAAPAHRQPSVPRADPADGSRRPEAALAPRQPSVPPAAPADDPHPIHATEPAGQCSDGPSGAGGSQLRLRALGTLGSTQLDRAARQRAAEWLGRPHARLAQLLPDDPGSTVFVESFVPPPRLVIVGATPIGHALCDMATRTGFEIVVVDPRDAFLQPARFPRTVELDARWPDEALAALDLDARTSVVILTHDEKMDEPALEAALNSACGYVGLLGGRHTQAKRREALLARGLNEAACDRIRGPVGLDIGATSPEQIAVSILAELIALSRAP